MRAERAEITQERFILSEGEGDTAFLRSLFAVRNIQGFDLADVGGKGGFKNALDGLLDRTGFKRKVKTLVLVADNDETPDASCKDIVKQIPVELPRPPYSLYSARRPDCPNVVVAMLPFSEVGESSKGCLETILLKAAVHHLPEQAGCARGYRDGLKVENWPASSKAKLELRCLLSGAWRDDPVAALQYCLAPERNLIPFDHAAFDDIAYFFRRLDEWIESGNISWTDWKNQQLAAERE
jgi:hypothetical protein